MKEGTVLIYGFNDKENSIECTYESWEMYKDGEIIINAICNDGSIIKAPIEMFKER